MPLEFLESVQQFRRSEGGGLEIAPPSGARYKNTPVGRGLKAYQFGQTPKSKTADPKFQ